MSSKAMKQVNEELIEPETEVNEITGICTFKRSKTSNRSMTTRAAVAKTVVPGDDRKTKQGKSPCKPKNKKEIAKVARSTKRKLAENLNSVEADSNNNATVAKLPRSDKTQSEQPGCSNKQLKEENSNLDDGIQVIVEDDTEFESEPDELNDEALVFEDEDEEICDKDRDHRRIRRSSGASKVEAALSLADSEISFTVDQEALMHIPGLSQMVQNMVKKQVDQMIEEMEKQGMIVNQSPDNNRFKQGDSVNMAKHNETPRGHRPSQGVRDTQRIRSPSDTTLYAPALKLIDGKGGENEIIDKISNFVESIRFEQSGKSPISEKRGQGDLRRVIQGRSSNMGGIDKQKQNNPGTPDQLELSKEEKCTDQMVLEAEKFQAALQALDEGRSPQVILSEEFGTGTGLSNDKFFHLTCHIDKGLQEKIEHGDFVDLEKLLPRNSIGHRSAQNSSNDGNRLEWVVKDGQTFLTPINDKNSKITGFCKWEQAFRMYATIYCRANPSWAKEIWQYISVINTAA